MGGNNHGNNDPFTKTKFSLPPFAGNVDPKAYLDWELVVQQKFDSHNVPTEHIVRLLLVSLLILLCIGGVIFAILIMLLLCLKLGML